MADSDIKAWLNGAQQLFDGPQDISEETPTTTGGLSDGSMAFFVGKPKTDGSGEWILKKVTPGNLNKMVFNYLTQSDIASQLASVLGVIQDRVNIQGNSTLTIPKGKKAAVIMCWCNTATASAPLIAVCSRTSSIQAVMDSACIMVGQETTNFIGIVVDSDGNIVVYNKLNQIVTFKYHLFLCEQ